MKTKKFVSALLASAVALSLVAGCGGGDKKKADEKKPAAAAGLTRKNRRQLPALLKLACSCP